jgi:hypothetical protein
VNFFGRQFDAGAFVFLDADKGQAILETAIKQEGSQAGERTGNARDFKRTATAKSAAATKSAIRNPATQRGGAATDALGYAACGVAITIPVTVSPGLTPARCG